MKRQLFGLLLAFVVFATPVHAQLAGPVTISAQDAGSCATANACADFGLGSNVAATIDIQGTFTGTLTFDGLTAAGLWRIIPVTAWTDLSVVTTASSAQSYLISNEGLQAVRVRATSWSSGTASIFLRQGYSSARPVGAVVPTLFDTANFVTQRAIGLQSYSPATTLTSSNERGRAIIERGPRWAITSAPAVSLQATATIAAEAGVRHIADTVCWSAGAVTAPSVATALLVNLRDGAAGAGTIIASWRVVAPATAGNTVPPFCINGLNLTGTTNTAMTIEWSALLTNLFQSVTLTGWHVF